MRPKVSVIIPIYKVEKYIRECVDSVLRQTLKDIEIILVDDGSPDLCPIICDEYANKDYRVKVIHQKNQGPSCARNNGIKTAIGEYVAFVDGDDVVSPVMLELLIENGSDAEIIECGVTQQRQSLLQNKKSIRQKKIFIDILAEYLKGNKVGVWCRIYKRTLIQNIEFEVGAFSEDVMWSYLVFERCRSYVIVDAILYFWRQCSDSLSKSSVKHFNSQSVRLAKIISRDHPELYPIISDHLVIVKINLLTNAARYGFSNAEVQKQFEEKEKKIALFSDGRQKLRL